MSGSAGRTVSCRAILNSTIPIRKQGKYHREADLDEPPKNSMNVTSEVIVTGLHWTSDKNKKLLLVAYMHHGIM